MFSQNNKAFEVHVKEKPLYYFFNFFMVNWTQPKFFEYMLFICSEIQYIAALLWTQNIFLTFSDTNSASQFVYSLSKAILICDYSTSEEGQMFSFFEIFSVFFWVYFGVIYVILGYLGSKALKREKINPFLARALCYLFQVHFGFIFWIANIVFLGYLAPELKGEDVHLFSDSQDQFFYCLHFLLIVSNYGFGLMTAIFCFDPFNSNNLFSVQSSLFQFLSFLFKALVPPLMTFFDCQTMLARIIYIIIALVISLGRFAHLIRTFPFYYYKTMIVTLVSSVLAFWISFINIVAFVCLSNDVISILSPIILVFLPLPFLIKFGLASLHKVIKEYLTHDPKILQTQLQVSKKIFAIQYLEEKVNLSLNEKATLKWHELYLMGILSNHSTSCQDKQCLCSFVLEKNITRAQTTLQNARFSLSYYFKMMNYSLLLGAISRIKNNSDLKIQLAYRIFSNPDSKLGASLMYVLPLSDKKSNLFLRIKKLIMAGNIQARNFIYFGENSAERLNLVDFVNFQTDTESFLSKIRLIIDKCLKFWQTYKEGNIKIRRLIKKNDHIEKLADHIEKMWISNIDRYDSFYHHTKEIYRTFLHLIRNTPFSSSEILRKHHCKEKFHELNPTSSNIFQEDLYSSKMLTVYVAMTRERLGRILYVSQTVHNSLGYSHEELIGKNISSLMPTSYAEEHDQVLLKHLEKAKNMQTNDFYQVIGYMKTKAGFITPCTAYATIFPYVQKELVYIGVMKTLDLKIGYIMIEKTGYIEALSENASKVLNLDPNNKILVKEICSDIERLGLSFVTKTTGFSRTEELSRIFLQPTLSRVQDEQQPLMGEVLTFVRYSAEKYQIKCRTKLKTNRINNKVIYVLEVDFDSEIEDKCYRQRSARFTPQDSILKNSTRESLLNIPNEIPCFEEIPISSSTSRSKNYLLTNSNRPLVLMSKISMTNQFVKEETDYLNMNRSSMLEQINNSQNTNLPLKINSTSLKNMLNLSNSSAKHDKVQKQQEKIPLKALPGLPHPSNRIQTEKTSETLKNFNSKLEKAIYALPKDKSLKIVKFLFWILALICVVLLLIFYPITKDKLDYVQENILVMTTSNLRLFQITELNRRARLVSLYKNDLIDDKRYMGFGAKNFLPTALLYINLVQGNLTINNILVRTAMERIDVNLQKQLYENVIPIIDPDKGIARYTNIFDAASDLIVQAKKLSKMNPSQVSSSTPELNFILNNTLNEQLLVSEQVTNMLLDDNELKLHFLVNLILCFTLFCCLLGAIVLYVFIYNQIRSVQSRNRFLEIFLRFNESEIDYSMSQLGAFKTNLLKNGLDLQPETYNLHLKQRISAKENRVHAKEANLQGINRNNFITQSFACILILLLLLPFIYLNIMINVKKDLIQEKSGTILEINNYFYDLNLISTAIYEYVQYNKTTYVRGRKIDQEIEGTFKRISGSQNLFINLLTNEEIKQVIGTTNGEILLSGDLCVLQNISSLICNLLKGITNKGIVGMNSFVELTLKRVKDMFDTSDYSFKSAKSALGFQNLIDMEVIYTLLQLPAYQKLGEILQDYSKVIIEDVNHLVIVTVIVPIIIYLLFGYLVSNQLWKIVENDKIRWKKMVRRTPFSISASNRAFINYIKKECNLSGEENL